MSQKSSPLQTASSVPYALMADIGAHDRGLARHIRGIGVQSDFCQKVLYNGADALERARLKALQQNTDVVPHALPQEAKYHKRLAFSLLIPLGVLRLEA
jgi:hypothetical protein